MTSAPTQPPLDSLNTLTRDVHQTILSNGLTVLTKEVHTAPVVSVQIWYRVGSRNESPGLNGLSHQLEHLLFKGTHTRPIQFGRLFSALGSDSNAFTSYDMTAYFGTAGRDKLEALLELEADRMRNVVIDAKQLASEKRVVISELQGYENSPDYRLGRAVMAQAFPDQPYGLPVGGVKSDVEQFTLDQVQDYYRRYYSPDNAVLAIVGDLDQPQTLEMVQRTFGVIPAASDAAPASNRFPTASVQTDAKPNSTPVILRQPGSAALLEAIFPIPDVQHPDVPAIDVMDTILSSGRNSRFYQALVNSGLASGASAYAAALIEPGWYTIAITADPDQDLEKIDQVLQQTIRELQQQPVTEAELRRAQTQLKASFILSNREVSHQASQLAYNHIVAGDYHYSDRYLERVARVTAADVQRVATTYLDNAKRTLGLFEPTQVEGQPMMGGGSPTQTMENFNPGEPVDPAVVAQYLPQLPAETISPSQALPQKFVLANGLRVLLLSDHSSPTVTLSGHLQAGNSFDMHTKAGVAALTAENLLSGTTSKDDLALAQALEDRGAGLDLTSFREGVEIDGYALAPDLPILLETLADVLQHATFPEDKLDLSRQRALLGLQVELDDPGRLGRRVFQQQIYPANHPFHIFPTQESLKAITQAEIVDFYQRQYAPGRTILTLVGDFDPAQARALIEQYFGAWSTPASTPELTFPTVPLPAQTKTVTAPLPGKQQVITYMGYRGIDRWDDCYDAALVLNQVLGGDTLASRLGTEIRDRQGLTYGIYSYFAAGAHPGPFVIQMQTAPEDTQQAIASTLKLLQQLRQQGITVEELKSAQRSLLNSYPVELADPDILTQRLLMNEVYGLDPETIRQFPQRIAAVSMADVQQAIETLIHPENLMIVTAGPVNKET